MGAEVQMGDQRDMPFAGLILERGREGGRGGREGGEGERTWAASAPVKVVGRSFRTPLVPSKSKALSSCLWTAHKSTRENQEVGGAWGAPSYSSDSSASSAGVPGLGGH